MIETRQNTHKKPKSQGCHCSDPKPDGTCCNLVCFERPNYFCGHLLTDTDLSKEQQYVIEKHKLYNRTLHGSGVVCGLRLTCGDEECCGSIVVDEGYAIDNCGNDLVVCEPLRFDVVSLLKEKGWVVGNAVYDPCAPEDDQDDCEYTQCFYVTVCYDEEPRDFTTPFVAGCRPTLTECEPTRIREGVRFDVLDKLPDENDWLKDLVNRLKDCFSIFTTGPFARALTNAENKRILESICRDPDYIEGSEFDGLNTLFCELRGLLILYLQKHPDKYNCKVADEIRRITLPDPNTNGFGQKVKNAFSSILQFAFRLAISCALGELVPRCQAPSKAGCVVLGTVEVKGGCVTHVCNCPREYVWSFANFFQVLLATMLGGVACEEKDEPVRKVGNIVGSVNAPPTVPGVGGNQPGPQRHVCCREFDASCEDLLPLLNVDPKFLLYAGTESVRAFDTMTKAFRSIFNFTDARMFSPNMLLGLDKARLDQVLGPLGIQDVRYQRAAVTPATPHPFDVLDRIGLARMSADTSLVVEHDEKDVVVNAYAVPSEMKTLQARVANLEEYIYRYIKLRKTIDQEADRPPETSTKRQASKKASFKRRRPRTPEGEEGENG